MQYQRIQPQQKIRQDRTPEQEYNRLLEQYAGIFRYNIPEYAEKIAKPRNIKRKNYAR